MMAKKKKVVSHCTSYDRLIAFFISYVTSSNIKNNTRSETTPITISKIAAKPKEVAASSYAFCLLYCSSYVYDDWLIKAINRSL
jgi:hypothetical protein